MAELDFQEKLIIIHCASCSIAFGMPKAFNEKRHNDHEYFYCPKGHRQYFPQESDIEKAERKTREANEADY